MQKVQTPVTEVRKSSSQGSVQNVCSGSPIKSNSPAKNSSPIKSNSLQAINSWSAYQLLDQIRKNTQLSHEMSKVAVTVVVSSLKQLLLETVSHYLNALLHQLQTPLTVSNEYRRNSLTMLIGWKLFLSNWLRVRKIHSKEVEDESIILWRWIYYCGIHQRIDWNIGTVLFYETAITWIISTPRA